MYKDIGSYGLVGNMHSVALVSKDGSVDFCAMPHVDSPTIFAAILDDDNGGRFNIVPDRAFESWQHYTRNTNILKTGFKTATGSAELLDFMPICNDLGAEQTSCALRRYVQVTSGSIDFKMELSPRPDYARQQPKIEFQDDLVHIESAVGRFTLACEGSRVNWSVDTGTLHGALSLEQGESVCFTFAWDNRLPRTDVKEDLQRTTEFWRDWLEESIGDKLSSLGEYYDLVCRSLLVLKLLTFQPTGAIAAAPTTSLPECIGGSRNWDYRFVWLRDASLTLKAFFSLGHVAEARNFIHFLHQTYRRYGRDKLQILYTLQGDCDSPEEILDHLDGYESSRPVRIGNGAVQQDQWDIYGEIMDSALRLSDYAGSIDEDLWPFFRDICELAVRDFDRPDRGIWEVRTAPRHFVYSKVMCWVAIDRGIKIASRYGFDAPLDKWRQARTEIKRQVLAKGYSKEVNSFVQAFGSTDLDASLLLIPIMKFLHAKDKRVRRTVAACRKHLMRGDFLRRYLADDGLSGQEGAFVVCNFWLAEILARMGRRKEATQLLSRTLNASNHLGLFAEEYDPLNKRLLGNFPQAFSHIGLINAIVAIKELERKRHRVPVFKTVYEFIRAKLPIRVVLNPPMDEKSKVSNEIAANLKKKLNELQGAFFDVQEGRVNYVAMKNSQSWQAYGKLAAHLNEFEPSTLETDEQKKAFWINVYNILIIHAVCHFNVNRSVRQVTGFFTRIGYRVGSFFFSADDIEHGILRGNRPRPGEVERPFSKTDPRNEFIVNQLDYRIHFALVCAASSCPPIEFYEFTDIDGQLDLAGKSFLNRRGLTLDRDRQTIYLSKVFKWYADDFGPDENSRLANILRHADQDARDYVQQNRRKLQIRYHPYEWNLNSTLS